MAPQFMPLRWRRSGVVAALLLGGCSPATPTGPQDAAVLIDAPDVAAITTDILQPAPDVPTVDIAQPRIDVPTADIAQPRIDVPTADIAQPAMDVPAADVGVARDVPAAVDAPVIPSDGGAPGAWELIGNFDNGLWQWGPYLAAAPDGTVYVARSRVGVYRGTQRDGRYTFDLLPTTGLTNLILSSLGVNDLGEPLLGCWGAMYGASGPGSIFRFNRAAGSWVASTIPAP